MSQKANYFKIGLFVIIAVTLIIIGTIVFSADSLVRDVIIVESYFNESVQGLDVGSEVVQRGVKIGRVDKITFLTKSYNINPDHPRYPELSKYVMVQMSLDKANFPTESTSDSKITENIKNLVENGLRMKITSQGITQVTFIQADFLDPERYPPPDLGIKPKNIYIPSAPSMLSNFMQSLDTILRRLDKIDYKRISNSLDNALINISTAIKDANIKQLRTELVNLISGLKDTNERIQTLLAKPKNAKRDASIAQAVINFQQSLEKLDNVIVSQQSDVARIIANIKNISENFRQLSESLKNDPSQLLMGSPPLKSETLK